jgi:hypothetical protein
MYKPLVIDFIGETGLGLKILGLIIYKYIIGKTSNLWTPEDSHLTRIRPFQA